MFQIIKKHVGKYWRYAAFTPLFVCLESFVSLLLPSLMSNIIDLGIAGGDRAYMWSCGVRMVLLALVGCICGIISTRCSTAAANEPRPLPRLSLQEVVETQNATTPRLVGVVRKVS